MTEGMDRIWVAQKAVHGAADMAPVQQVAHMPTAVTGFGGGARQEVWDARQMNAGSTAKRQLSGMKGERDRTWH